MYQRKSLSDSNWFHLFFSYGDSMLVQTLIFLISTHFVVLSAMFFTCLACLLGQHNPYVGWKLLMVASFFPQAQCLVTHSSLLSHGHSLAWMSKSFWDAVFQGTWSMCLSSKEPTILSLIPRGSQQLSYVVR